MVRSTFVLCVSTGVLFAAAPAFAAPIHCNVFQPTSGGSWELAGSFDTDAINYPEGWHPFGLTNWKAEFTSVIKVDTSGVYGFDYLHAGWVDIAVGGYPFIGWGASGSTPGMADWSPAVMTHFDGWNLSAGYWMFGITTSTVGNPGQWRGAGSGAVVNWDPGITYVPEPATMSLLALGALALIRRRRTA